MLTTDDTTLAVLSGAASVLIWMSTGPQAYQTLKTRLTRDLSLMNLVFCVLGLSLWTAFAILIEQWIFMVGDGVDMAMWSSVLAVKVNNVIKKNEKNIIFKDGSFCQKFGHIYLGKWHKCLICNEEK
jgi:uncharacterized protein with PQ loop repeat